MILLLFFFQVAYGKAQGVLLRDQQVTLFPRGDVDLRPLEVWRIKWAEERMYLVVGKEVVFDTKITRDQNGFRTIPDTNSKKKLNYHLFFGGCSFIFGQGLDDAETAPAMLSKRLPETRIVNMGAPGSGVSDQLYLWRNFRWNEIYKEKKGLMFYGIFSDHFERLMRTWRYLDWARDVTPYFEPEAGHLVYRGVLLDTWDYRWAQWLRRMGLSEWWLRGAFHFSRLGSTNRVQLMVQHLSALKREYLAQFPEGRFVLVWRPYRLPWSDLREREEFLRALEDARIEYWQASEDFAERDRTGGDERRRIKGDGHPNAFANQEFSEHLVQKIRSTTSQPTL